MMRRGLRKVHRRVLATPEQLNKLLHELELLYVEYQHADGDQPTEAFFVDVVDDETRQSEQWYQRLLFRFVPYWPPVTREVLCWRIPSLLLEDGKTYVYLYLSV